MVQNLRKKGGSSRTYYWDSINQDTTIRVYSSPIEQGITENSVSLYRAGRRINPGPGILRRIQQAPENQRDTILNNIANDIYIFIYNTFQQNVNQQEVDDAVRDTIQNALQAFNPENYPERPVPQIIVQKYILFERVNEVYERNTIRGGAKKYKHTNGRMYTIHTGTRGGKYICIGKNKDKFYI